MIVKEYVSLKAQVTFYWMYFKLPLSRKVLLNTFPLRCEAFGSTAINPRHY